MDNVTHSLTGLALARAGIDRWCPRAAVLLLLSANAPDCDILALTRGQLAYFEVHRGYTHSLLLLPVMALLSVLVTAAIYREKLPWLRAWLVGCLGVGSHLLLDATLNYGVRPLIPFSSRWFYLDLNYLYDWNILLILSLAALLPLLARLVSSEIGERPRQGRGIARLALLFLVLYDTSRFVLHGRAVAQLESRLYDGLPPVAVSALPLPFNPFRWTGIVETAGTYRAIPVDTLSQLDTEQEAIFFKPPVTELIKNVQREEAFRFFLYFARFPVWSEQPALLTDAEGRRIELTDLRFGRPGAGGFHCVAIGDKAGRVMESWFTFGDGRER